MAESHDSGKTPPLWGVSAEFATAGGMVAAIVALRDRGLAAPGHESGRGRSGMSRIDAFSPVPVPEAQEALRLPRQTIHHFALLAALLGGVGVFGMCTYATIWSYRFNIGGRPLFSWPSFLVPSVASAMLAGALGVVLMLLILNRLPRLNHPAFNIPGFVRCSSDRFYVAVEARGDDFDPERVEAVLATLPIGPVRVSRVPR